MVSSEFMLIVIIIPHFAGCSLNPTVYAFLNSDLRKKLNGKSVAGDKQTLGDAASGATALTSDKQKGHKSMAED